MKVVYCVRLFSGIESSAKTGEWNPTGVPTIYKVIEALDQCAEKLTLIFVCKDGNVRWPLSHDIQLSLIGLKSKPFVLAGVARFPSWLGRTRLYMREVFHTFRVLAISKKAKPDILYFDYGNLFSAAIAARIFNIPVVLRVMGVYPAMRNVLDGTAKFHKLFRWCYNSPFSLVICTQDGSGVEKWLERAFQADVRRETLINGLDISEDIKAVPSPFEVPENRTVVAFVGKLEPEKGALEFTEAYVQACLKAEKRMHAVIIGTGSLSEKIKERLESAGMSKNATLIDRLPHAQIISVLKKADIYVSLNRYGNLSNANLEALGLGVCSIFPKSQTRTGVDLITDRLIPESAVERIASSDDIDGLVRLLLKYHSQPEERKSRAAATAKAMAAFIGTWDDRVTKEMIMLRSLSQAKRPV